MSLTTVSSRAAAALVALVAGFASYRHIVDVAMAAGEHDAVAYALPLAIDGLIVVGTAAMIEDKRAGRIPRPSARVALVVGVVATLAANIASAQPTPTARLVAAVPAVAFLLAVEVLSRSGKPRRTAAGFDPYVPTAVEPVPVEPVPIGPAPARVSRRPAVEPVPGEPVRRRATARSLTAAQRVTSAHEAEPDATHERIATVAGCSVATVKRHRPERLMGGSPSGAAPAETVNGAGVAELIGADR